MLAGLPDSVGPALTAATDWDYATIYDVSSAAPRILVVSLRRGPDRSPLAIYGFGVPAGAFYAAMLQLPAAPSLLPLTPAERSPNDSLLSVALMDGGAVRFVATRHRYAPRYAVSIPFLGMAGIATIEVTLHPGLAPRLLIGGVPTSRLPLLVRCSGCARCC